MRRKEIAKKLGITIMACMLALPCTVPAVCPAAVHNTGTPAAGQEETLGLTLTTKTFKKEFKTEDGIVYKEVSFEYPAADGSSQAAQAFNRFYKSLLKKWKKATKENLKDAESYAAESESGSHYTDEVTCQITSNNKEYISVLQTGYDYTMGAHGMPYRYSYIFDAKTGQKVSAAKMLGISKSKLNQKVRSLYLAEFDKTQKEENYMFYQNREEVKATLDEIDFNKNLYYLEDGKIRFYVDPYAVGPYAAGFIEVEVTL